MLELFGAIQQLKPKIHSATDSPLSLTASSTHPVPKVYRLSLPSKYVPTPSWDHGPSHQQDPWPPQRDPMCPPHWNFRPIPVFQELPVWLARLWISASQNICGEELVFASTSPTHCGSSVLRKTVKMSYCWNDHMLWCLHKWQIAVSFNCFPHARPVMVWGLTAHRLPWNSSAPTCSGLCWPLDHPLSPWFIQVWPVSLCPGQVWRHPNRLLRSFALTVPSACDTLTLTPPGVDFFLSPKA